MDEQVESIIAQVLSTPTSGECIGNDHGPYMGKSCAAAQGYNQSLDRLRSVATGRCNYRSQWRCPVPSCRSRAACSSRVCRDGSRYTHWLEFTILKRTGYKP